MTLEEAINNYSGIADYLSRYYDPDAEVKLSITNGKCIEWFTEISEWLTELKELKAADRWISVDDKQPEQDEKVLVLTKDKDIMTMIYKVIPFRWYKPKFGGFDKDYVTHWKPLPKPPKE